MNPTIDTLLKRKSVRVYEERAIEPEARELILQAAMRAPTAGNMMLYTIIEVTEPALKDRLAVTCDNQPFIARAPLVLLFVADYQRWWDSYMAMGVEAACAERGIPLRRPGEGDLLLACCDALIAAQSAVTAAEGLGIGSCYIGDILEQAEEHIELFDLPPYTLPVAMVCFGYPTPDQAARPQITRFAPEFIVHANRYRRLHQDEIERMFAPRAAQMAAGGPRVDGIANPAQFNYLKKFSAEFSYEMTRSVRKWIERWNRG